MTDRAVKEKERFPRSISPGLYVLAGLIVGLLLAGVRVEVDSHDTVGVIVGRRRQ